MSERRGLAARLAPVALVVVLGSAMLLDGAGVGTLALPTSPAADRFVATLDALPDEATVLVGFDPDLGTYAEIRPTVRAVLGELVARGARIAIISLTPEGRALAIAEVGRMRRNGSGAGIVDLGFVPGAEAALVSLARGAGAAGSGLIGPMPAVLDLGEVAMALVIGGNDLGPRSWVEQLAPRVSGLELAALAPSLLLPELQPYVGSGQLAALVATPRDGASLREGLDGGDIPDDRPPVPLAVLIGLVAAIAVLGAALVGRMGGVLRTARAGESA